MRARIEVIWNRDQLEFNISPILSKFENYLRSKGYRDTSIFRYLALVKTYLEENKSIKSSVDEAVRFRASLLNFNRKRATINLYSAVIYQSKTN
jgi:hypothetical protein